MLVRREAVNGEAARDALSWLKGELASGPSLRSWIPDLFDGYARLLHPAYRSREDGSASEPVTWKDIAAWSGRQLKPSTSFEAVERRESGLVWSDQPGHSAPESGQLEVGHFRRLSHLLAETTSTPDDLLVLTWSGYGHPTGGGYSRKPRAWSRARSVLTAAQEELELSACLSATGRRYLLHRGSLQTPPEGESTGIQDPPSFWWPSDRSWFVSTDIESRSTYVAASTALIERLLADGVFEVLAASLDDPFDGVEGVERLQ